MVINIIDPGHGGNDPGAIFKEGTTQTTEAILNLKIANRCINLLENYQTIYPTRIFGTQDNPELNKRLRLALERRAQNYVSIHCNIFSDPNAKGLEVFHKKGCAKSISLANKLTDNIIRCAATAGYQYTNRGVKTQELYINHAPCPAVLIECGFISNPKERAWLRSAVGQITIGYAIAKTMLEVE